MRLGASAQIRLRFAVVLCGGRRRSRSLWKSYQNEYLAGSLGNRGVLQSAVKLIVRHCGAQEGEEYLKKFTDCKGFSFDGHGSTYTWK